MSCQKLIKEAVIPDTDWRVNMYRGLPKKRKRMYGNVQLGAMALELKERNPRIKNDEIWKELIDSYGDLILGVANPDSVEKVFSRHGIINPEHEAQRFINFILVGLA